MGNCQNYYPFNYAPTTSFPDPYDFYQGLQPPTSTYQFYYSTSTNNLHTQNQYFQLDPTLHTGANGWLGPASYTTYNTRYTTHVGGGSGNDKPGLLASLATISNYLRAQDTRVPKWFAQTNYWSPARKSSNIGVGVSVFLPHYFWWYRDTNVAVYLGSLPEVFHVFMRDLTPGQTITLGTDQYLIFPYNQKHSPFQVDYITGDSRTDRCYGMGMAVKKN